MAAKKKVIKPIPLNPETLGAYNRLGVEISEAKRKREELRIGIMLALKLKKRLTPAARQEGYSAGIISFERTVIPWAEEAGRWKAIALGYAKRLGIPPRKLAKLNIEYPKLPAERLEVKLQDQAVEEDI